MAEQIRAERQTSGNRSNAEPAQVVAPNQATIERGKKLKAAMDAIVDDIDNHMEEWLKEKALRNFRQQGGE